MGAGFGEMDGCCDATKGCRIVGEGAGGAFVAAGGSMTLAIAGEADARLTGGDGCAVLVPFGGFEGRGSTV